MQRIRLDSVDSNEFLLSRVPKKEKESRVLENTNKSNKTSNGYSNAHLTQKQRERRRQYKIRKGDV